MNGTNIPSQSPKMLIFLFHPPVLWVWSQASGITSHTHLLIVFKYNAKCLGPVHAACPPGHEQHILCPQEFKGLQIVEIWLLLPVPVQDFCLPLPVTRQRGERSELVCWFLLTKPCPALSPGSCSSQCLHTPICVCAEPAVVAVPGPSALAVASVPVRFAAGTCAGAWTRAWSPVPRWH